MICLLLGASGKIGRVFLKELISSSYFDTFVVQFNSNHSFLNELGVTEILSGFPTKLKLNNGNLVVYKVNFSDVEEVKGFARDLVFKFSKVDVILNFLSDFSKSGIQIEENEITKILDTNFMNQSLFFREIREILREAFVVQFLDYSVFDPYPDKYFWYSVSRYCMFGFMKTFEKYLKKNGYGTKFLYVFPKVVERDEKINELFKVVFELMLKREEGEIIF